MKKTILVVMGLLLVSVFTALGAHDGKTDGFVCPVFNDNSAVGDKNPNAQPIANGDYTIVGPSVSVPLEATNQNGAGSPGGDHASPGDTDYTAIWAGQ